MPRSWWSGLQAAVEERRSAVRPARMPSAGARRDGLRLGAALGPKGDIGHSEVVRRVPRPIWWLHRAAPGEGKSQQQLSVLTHLLGLCCSSST